MTGLVAEMVTKIGRVRHAAMAAMAHDPVIRLAGGLGATEAGRLWPAVSPE